MITFEDFLSNTSYPFQSLADNTIDETMKRYGYRIELFISDNCPNTEFSGNQSYDIFHNENFICQFDAHWLDGDLESIDNILILSEDKYAQMKADLQKILMADYQELIVNKILQQ